MQSGAKAISRWCSKSAGANGWWCRTKTPRFDNPAVPGLRQCREAGAAGARAARQADAAGPRRRAALAQLHRLPETDRVRRGALGAAACALSQRRARAARHREGYFRLELPAPRALAAGWQTVELELAGHATTRAL